MAAILKSKMATDTLVIFLVTKLNVPDNTTTIDLRRCIMAPGPHMSVLFK